MDAREFIGEYLAHAYDPVKAKEYYERTKKLKGKRSGVGKDTQGRPPGKAVAVAGPVKKAVAPKAVASRGARAAALKERLGRLEEVLGLLQDKVAAAQARSGVEGTAAKKTAATAKKAASTEPSKDKTSAQKKDAAKASAKAYEKNKTAETSKDAQAVQDEIEEVQRKIAEARDALAAVLAKARASSPKPKTAAKPPSKPQLKEQEGRPSK